MFTIILILVNIKYKLSTLHTLAHNFVFSPNHLLYLALLHPATILAKTFGTLGLFLL